jgi:transcriptional regulator of acetoin/glycerol metabolism
MAKSGEVMKLEELSPSLRILLKAEAMRRGADPEALLMEILAGGNPIPQHLSDLVREALKSGNRWPGNAE